VQNRPAVGVLSMRYFITAAVVRLALTSLVVALTALAAIADPLVFVQIPRDNIFGDDHPNVRIPSPLPLGSRIILYDPDKPEDRPVNLSTGFVAAQDPEVYFDGEKILFSGRLTESDSWDLWQVRLDGSELQRLVDQPGHDFQPVYTGCLNTLNDPEFDQILFVSTEAEQLTEDGSEKATALYTCKLDGSYVHRVSYNLSSDFDPYILQDSRVVFTSWQQNAGRFPPKGLFPLFVMCIDGTDMMPFYGNHDAPLIKRMARETFDNHVVFVEAKKPLLFGGGRLARVSLRRNLHSHEILADTEKGLYAYPCPLPDGDLLVSYKRDAPDKTYGIYRFDMGERRLGEMIFDDPDWHEMDVQRVAPRKKPRGRSTVVNYAKPGGFLYCLDTYISDLKHVRELPKGTLKRLRVIEGVPVTPANKNEMDLSGFAPRRIVADIPIEEDGSFHIEVPPMTPLYLQVLDERHAAVETLRSWIWVMPMEKRGCIGCHEDREMTPPNRFVKANMRHGWKLTIPPERRRTVGFRDKVWPILQSSCEECHADQMSGGPRETYKMLLSARSDTSQPFVQPGSARDSRLIWVLFGERLDGTGDKMPVHPMPSGGSLDPFDRQTLVEWIDLGAPWESPRATPTP